MDNIGREAQRAMGLAPYDSREPGVPERERGVLDRANEVLGFKGVGGRAEGGRVGGLGGGGEKGGEGGAEGGRRDEARVVFR